MGTDHYSDCLKIEVLKPNLSGIPKTEFARRTAPDGQQYYKVEYKLEMRFDEMISFKFKFQGMYLEFRFKED